MLKNKKIPFIIYIFFVLVYANQGFSDLPSQCIYYLTREGWHLSVTMLGLLAFLTSFAWYVKPLFGLASDYFGRKNKLKQYLIINTLFIIIASLFIIMFGLNFWTLIIIMFLINIAIAGNDTTNDKQMCELEQKHDLSGKIQAIQWTSLGFAGLFVAIGGAWIADKIPEPYNYKVAFGIMLVIPILLLGYLLKYYKNSGVRNSKVRFDWSYFKNKEFLIGILFIVLLRFSPSFGTGLMVKMRETMGIEKMFLGYLGATGTVLGIVGYLIYYWKAWKIPLKKLLYFAIIFSALTNLCYLYIPNKWVVMGYNVAFGAFDGVCFLAVLAFMAKIVPVGSEGVYYAVLTSLNNLSGRLGGVIGGLLYDNFGYNVNVIVASITTLLCLFLVPYLVIKEKSNAQLS